MLKCISILFSIGLLFSGVAPVMAAKVNPAKGQALRCDLPAPENFQIVSTTSNSVTLSWDPVPGAVAYEVRAYSLNSPSPFQFQIVTGTTATFNNLNPNFVYRFEVAGICENDDRGEWASIEGKPTGIVLDLVPDRHGTPELKEVSADPGTLSTYTLDWVVGDSYWFEIKANGTSYSRYTIVVPDPSFMGDFSIAKESEYLITYPYGFRSFIGWMGPFLADNAEFIRICYGYNPDNSAIGDVTINLGMPNTFKFTWNNLNPSYSFKLFKRASAGLKSNEDRQGSDHDVSTDLQISPNPFQSTIQITGLNPAVETDLHLFRYDGALVLSQQSTAVQNYNLPTSDLPAGVYFLRTSAEGVQKTHKLVKIR